MDTMKVIPTLTALFSQNLHSGITMRSAAFENGLEPRILSRNLSAGGSSREQHQHLADAETYQFESDGEFRARPSVDGLERHRHRRANWPVQAASDQAPRRIVFDDFGHDFARAHGSPAQFDGPRPHPRRSGGLLAHRHNRVLPLAEPIELRNVGKDLVGPPADLNGR